MQPVQILCVPSHTLGDQYFAAPINMVGAKRSLEEIAIAFNDDDGYADEVPNLISFQDLAAAYRFIKIDQSVAIAHRSGIQTCAVRI
jgi:hypothetical protein